MAIVREGIENVRADVLADAIAGDGAGAAFTRTVLVTWKSNRVDVLFQVYVNGAFAGATEVLGQRQLVVQTPSSFEAAMHLEVVAVDPTQAHRDWASELDRSTIHVARIGLALLRSQTLSIGAKANVYSDNGTGEIDYDSPLNAEPIVLWPCRQDKAGFGLAQMGLGDWGYDGAAAVGFGKGLFGLGQFGLDADAVTWISPMLPLGVYRLAVKLCDGQGHESPACPIGPIAITPTAKPASALNAVTFDRRTNELTLSVSG